MPAAAHVAQSAGVLREVCDMGSIGPSVGFHPCPDRAPVQPGNQRGLCLGFNNLGSGDAHVLHTYQTAGTLPIHQNLCPWMLITNAQTITSQLAGFGRLIAWHGSHISTNVTRIDCALRRLGVNKIAQHINTTIKQRGMLAKRPSSCPSVLKPSAYMITSQLPAYAGNTVLASACLALLPATL